LKNALTQVLACFRLGANSIFSNILGRRIDRILFAATKADLLHQTSHDRLENILRLIIEDASAKAEFSGATIDVAALAAIRATREAKVKEKTRSFLHRRRPQKGESWHNSSRRNEVAVFPVIADRIPSARWHGTGQAEIRALPAAALEEWAPSHPPRPRP
jgi:hypothetical protein